MSALGGILITVLAMAVAVLLIMYVVVPVFRGLGWLVRHVASFLVGVVSDALRAVGAIVAAPVYVLATLGSIVLGRWSAAAHFGRALQDELLTVVRSAYNIAIGRPARLLLLTPLVEGIEERVPQAFAQAPGPDKPSRKTGQFEGYRIVGSLKGGGSGARLYIAEPDERKLAAFARQGRPAATRVVIKAFSLAEGSTLPQIVRESRALEAARDLGLILDHGMTPQRFFYVMPYVPGEDLNVVTRRMHQTSGPQGLEDGQLREALGYMVDLLRTLDRYHRGGLWHKDVKPDNIIVHDGAAHLVDLGLVTPLRSAMTLTTHGTEYFRDPEMVRMALKGVKVHQVDGAKFDIFAAGAVLYSMVENSFPMHGGLSQVTRRCPESVRWIIRRAMAEYKSRYPSAAAMLSDVRHVLASEDLFAVRPADLPSVAQGDSPDLAQPSVAAAASPPAAGAQGDAAAEAVATAASSYSGAAQQAGADAPPRVTVRNWWTGAFSVDGSDSDAQQRRRADAKRPGSPASRVARTPRPPRAAAPRASAQEQLRRARARVDAARRRAQERMGRRRRCCAPNEKMNPGVWAAVFISVFVGIAVANRASKAPAVRSSVATAPDAGSAAHTTVTIVGEEGAGVSDAGAAAVEAVADKLHSVADRLRVGVVKPALTVAAQAAEAVESLPAAPAAGGLWLVLNDVGPSAPTPLRARAQGALALLALRGWSLAGVGDSERDINLAASARSAIGVDTTRAAERLRDWLEEQGELLRGVILLRRAPSDAVEAVVVARPEAQAVQPPIAQALRLALTAAR